MNRISGPLLDRIDIQVEIQPVAFDDMANTILAGSSASDRILRVARTISDLESAQSLPPATSPDYASALQAAVNAPALSHHITEAIGYRNLDRSNYGTSY